MSRPAVWVLGVDGDRVSERALRPLTAATLVAGGARHLDALAPAGAERVVLDGRLEPAIERIAGHDGPAAVLASGDPGFFGILRVLAARLGRERLRVEPAPSSVARAFARAGLPWDDAVVVSAHGRDPAAALNMARAHPKVAILTAPDVPPRRLAAALAGSGRRLLVAERLGLDGERVVEGSPEEIAAQSFADPNVVLVIDPSRTVARAKARTWPARGPAAWALPEEAFAHRDGMITKAEVRALALARIGPGPGDLVWDVGAGSGSVAVECARLGAAAVAVDRDPAMCALARENACAHDVDVTVLEGAAPAALAALPEPDAAFIGGGGADLPAILDAVVPRARRAVVLALAMLERVGPALDRLAAAGLETEATMLQASRLRPLAGAHRLAAENPVFLVCGRRP